MILAFTGSRSGLTPHQAAALEALLESLEGLTALHHGCCLGADEDCALLLAQINPSVLQVGHPCNLLAQVSQQALAVCRQVLPVRPPLNRNHDLVDAAQLLIACPDGPERLHSGTWATVRHARKQGKPIHLLWPDGTGTQE